MEKKKSLLIFILALGAFSIINTELGVMGVLPMIAEFYDISIAQAGAMVSVFALVVMLEVNLSNEKNHYCVNI